MRYKLLLLVFTVIIGCGFWWLQAHDFAPVKILATRLDGSAPAIQYQTVNAIPPPKGFVRTTEGENTFGSYLRQMPLKQGEQKVYLYDGNLKGNQAAHWAVINMDTGDKNLQQCADVTMRLWGEYLFQQKRYNDIKFNFLNDGKPRYFKDYAKGDYSYATFRKYMDWIFTYANTASLYKELTTVSVDDLKAGDVFIQTGVPVGHAVIVVDMAQKPGTGEKVFLLAQGYMPAQDMHILKNPNDGNLSPWYSTNFGSDLVTPEFVFRVEKDYKIKRYGK